MSSQLYQYIDILIHQSVFVCTCILFLVKVSDTLNFHFATFLTNVTFSLLFSLSPPPRASRKHRSRNIVLFAHREGMLWRNLPQWSHLRKVAKGLQKGVSALMIEWSLESWTFNVINNSQDNFNLWFGLGMYVSTDLFKRWLFLKCWKIDFKFSCLTML